ncbi:MAG TPA: hypothetical protein VFE50_23555 [Cyclobacteriaceae bacterium]|nr:hypothetical protein [Cyclobacteriaceae bacterium]
MRLFLGAVIYTMKGDYDCSIINDVDKDFYEFMTYPEIPSQITHFS